MRAEIESLKKVAAKVLSSSLQPEVDSDFAAEVIDPVKGYSSMRFSAVLPPKSPSTRLSAFAASSGAGIGGGSGAGVRSASRQSRPSTGGAKSPKDADTHSAAFAVATSSSNSNAIAQMYTPPAGRVLAPPRRRSPTAAAVAAAAYSSPSPFGTRPSSSSSHIAPSALRSRPSSSHVTPLSAPPSLVTRRSTSAVRGSRSRSKEQSRDRSASREGGCGYASSHDLRLGGGSCACTTSNCMPYV
jgi:hypothetical protein